MKNCVADFLNGRGGCPSLGLAKEDVQGYNRAMNNKEASP